MHPLWLGEFRPLPPRCLVLARPALGGFSSLLWLASACAAESTPLLAVEAGASPCAWARLRDASRAGPGWGWIWPRDPHPLWRGERLWRPPIRDILSPGQGGVVWLDPADPGAWALQLEEAREALLACPAPPALLLRWDALQPGLGFGSYHAAAALIAAALSRSGSRLLLWSSTGFDLPEAALASCGSLVLEACGSFFPADPAPGSPASFEPFGRPCRRAAWRPDPSAPWLFGRLAEHRLSLQWEFRGEAPFEPLNPPLREAERRLLSESLPAGSERPRQAL